jgi:hypothetical protein
MRPQTNGICEQFHKTIGQKFYDVTFRKKVYKTIEQLQKDLDEWMAEYDPIEESIGIEKPLFRLFSILSIWQGLRCWESLKSV